MDVKTLEAIKYIVNRVNEENDTQIGLKFDNDEQTCFDWTEDTIIIGYDFEDKNAHMAVLNHIRDEHGFADAYKYSDHLWSILHEFGHYFTDDDELYQEDLEMRAMYALIPAPETFEQYEKIAYGYFNLPTEWAATEWAIEYIKTHEFECDEFAKII